VPKRWLLPAVLPPAEGGLAHLKLSGESGRLPALFQSRSLQRAKCYRLDGFHAQFPFSPPARVAACRGLSLSKQNDK
jgi:hypothetical protein